MLSVVDSFNLPMLYFDKKSLLTDEYKLRFDKFCNALLIYLDDLENVLDLRFISAWSH